jgi:glycine cleavage system H protein
MTPNDRKYTKTHEWVKIEGNTAIVGITDHAQTALGDITFVEKPTIGKTVGQGAECGVIESVKAASDIFAPVSGKIAEFNVALEDNPAVVNEDPYGKGWILKLTDVRQQELDNLMDAAGYDKAMTEEG